MIPEGRWIKVILRRNEMKEFLELVKERYSCRSFSDKGIDDEILSKILEAGRLAPTARNSQPQIIYVAKSKEAVELAKKCSPCVYNAPVVLIVGFDKTKAASVPTRGNYNFGEMDASIVITHMMMEAADLGVDSCWVGMFDPKLTQETFNVPENIQIVSFLPIGYAAADGKPGEKHTSRKASEETIKFI